ncbi:MAG: hypothetical protein U1F83_06300 [Verrucomicrobiota bacterium]
MGECLLIHGFIACPGWGRDEADRRVLHHNSKVIEQLPVSDSEWPFLTKTMFASLPLRTSRDQNVPQYDTHLIHFAATYKGGFLLSANWLKKFEGLLSKLCWFDVTVICSGYAYQWVVDRQTAGEQFGSNPPIPCSKWRFYYVELFEKPASKEDSIDGVFTSDHHQN